MLRERIDRLRRRAERLGLSPPELIETGERRDQDGPELCLVELRGALPRLAGWRAVAELHHDEAGTRVEVVPGEALPAGDWQDAPPRCDHCGLRRRRRTTVLLRHRSGDVAQVGTGCLEDFTGERDLLASASLRSVLEEASGPGIARDDLPEPTMGDFLTAVAADARERGFVAKADASDPTESTAERAARRLGNGGESSAADRKLADDVERWVLRELAETPELSAYEARLVSVFRRSERVGERDAAIVASAWLSYERAQQRGAWGRYAGDVGQTVEVEVSVRKVRRAERESRWGPVVWHALRDENGLSLSWFAVGKRLEEGARYRLRGRVRRHESFRGQAVTVLERCRVVDR
jgi:hypothetical protein